MEAHVVMYIPDTLEIVVISSNDELMKDLEEDPEKDPEFEEHQIDHQVAEVELSAFDHTIDLDEKPEDDLPRTMIGLGIVSLV